MSDVQIQAALRLRTVQGQKSAALSFTNSSLVSPTTPTLANPIRGFGSQINTAPPQTVTEVAPDLQEAQFADEQLLEPEVIQEKPLTHDISRISLRRPQAKLTVGEPDDQYEQEADRVANQVMRMVIADKLKVPSVQPVQDSLQRKCAACEQEEEKLQAKPSLQRYTDGSLQAGDNIESRLNSSKGGGSSLPGDVRFFMEPRFGYDFSQVRVHTGTEAVQMNQELGAQAFTHGSDVYFGAGKSPGNNELTAHELTHVVQQTVALQRKCTTCQEEDDQIRRKENEEILTGTPSNGDASQSSNSTAKLLDLIARLEQLHTHSDKQIVSQASTESSDNPPLQKEGQQHLGTLSNGLEQLRAVARSDDETLKQQVLGAFTPSAMQTAQVEASNRVQAVSGSSFQSSATASIQRAPISIATKSLTISSQQNAAEIEADQVAEVVTSGKSVAVSQHSPKGSINRFSGGEELIALGTALLVADAEAAPVEAVTGPPGWAIGLGIAVAAVVIIGVGAVISSDTPATPEPEVKPVPQPIPVPVPVPVPRRYPNQTCEDSVLDTLQEKMHDFCDTIGGESCSPSKVSRKKLARRPCSEIRKRIQAVQECMRLRQDIQDQCFDNKPDQTHKDVMEQLRSGLQHCLDLEKVNCAPGHPMANL
ncbi:eCIS core domain-containing protein [Nostoc sp.]|uniref:eCIS core domain-containing protein n=1 Tax=Nostoc sp. TaxID=1180 RepID=UPI002FF9BB93